MSRNRSDGDRAARGWRGAMRGVAVVAWLVAPSLVSAQGRETLETKVTVRGDQVVLEWSDKHPWDAMLLSNAPVLLFEYRQAGGQVALDCLAGYSGSAVGRGCPGVQGARAGGPRSRSLAYTLPPALTGVPAGNACLLFRMGDQRLLPLRKVDRDKGETARFRYPEWEALVRGAGGRALAEQRVSNARRALQERRDEVAALEKEQSRRGGATRAACDAIPAPSLEEESSGRPIAEAAELDLVARQVCVMRVRNAGQNLARETLADHLRSNKVLPPSVLDSVLALLPRPRDGTPLLARDRQSELEIFRRDYARLAPQAARYRDDVLGAGYTEPHFGLFTDSLKLQSISRAGGNTILAELQQGKPVTEEFVRGWVGTHLEAYTRCVADGRAQLATTRTTTLELEQRRPALQEAARQALVKSCQTGAERLETLRAQLGPLEQALAAAERALADIPASVRPLSTPAREVNREACVP
jgi:hypothetical protein